MEDYLGQSRGNNPELMQVSAESDAETKYLQDVRSLDESLDQSMDSLQGSLTLPSFTMEQSSDLQGSHGFRVLDGSVSQWVSSSIAHQELGGESPNLSSGLHDASINNSSRRCLEKQFSADDNYERNVQSDNCNGSEQRDCAETVYPVSGMLNVVGVGGGVGEIGSLSSLGGSIMFTTGQAGQMVYQRDVQGDGQSSEGKLETCSSEGRGDSTGGITADKTVPKRRNKKPRSTSSLASEMGDRGDQGMSGRSPSRSDVQESQGGSDLGFKPSLLDEILTEKKLALLKSPEVIRFLQAQQHNLVKDPISHRHDMDS